MLQTALMKKKVMGLSPTKCKKLVFKKAKVRDSCFYVT